MKFNLENKQLIKSCKPILERIYKKNKRKYIDLFFYEKDVEFDLDFIGPFIIDLLVERLLVL